MTVDELLANPNDALQLPAGAIPVHAILIVEYLEPDSDNHPRIATEVSDGLPTWSAIGMLRFMEHEQYDDAYQYEPDEGE